jgi:GDP-D-mannose dehydratase
MSKLKLNFATRVASMVMSKSETSNAFNAERAKVQASVNANPVIIDRTVFRKTEIEKLELANAKAKWKKTLV